MVGRTFGVPRTVFQVHIGLDMYPRMRNGYTLARLCTQECENGYTLAWMCTQERHLGYV